MKYRKKPVVIEAIQLSWDTRDDIVKWIGDPLVTYGMDRAKPFININTIEGVMTANEGDYVIKGIAGEFYPCRSDIFEATYDKVEE